MKFGFELEGFCVNAAGQLCLVPAGIPCDDCGWLVEYRGRPAESVLEAAGLLESEKYRVQKLLYAAGLSDAGIAHAKVPRGMKLAARREHAKGVLRYQNLYGLSPSTADTAGLHVHFTRPASYWEDGKAKATFNRLWDFPQLFRALDKRFAGWIKATKRKPGFYEIKPDGQIEYRSLPSTISLWEVAEFLHTWNWNT